MDIDHVISQSILFMIAGFETSSTLLGFAAYELALNPEVQNTLRAEIKSVLEKHNNVCNYDAVQDMHYLEMVLLGNKNLISKFSTARNETPFRNTFLLISVFNILIQDL